MPGCSKNKREIIRENAFPQKKKKHGFKFNPGLALTSDGRFDNLCIGNLLESKRIVYDQLNLKINLRDFSKTSQFQQFKTMLKETQRVLRVLMKSFHLKVPKVEYCKSGGMTVLTSNVIS